MITPFARCQILRWNSLVLLLKADRFSWSGMPYLPMLKIGGNISAKAYSLSSCLYEQIPFMSGPDSQDHDLKRKLINKMMHGMEKGQFKVVLKHHHHLRKLDPHWPSLLNHQQRMPTGVLFLLRRHGLDNELELFKQDLDNANFQFGPGMLSNLMAYYCERKVWTKACDILELLKEQQLMKHTRMYHPLIKGLLQDRDAQKAFALFQELLVMEKRLPTLKYNSVDVKLVVSLILAAAQLNRNGRSQSGGKETPLSDQQQLPTAIAASCFSYLRNSGSVLSDELRQAVCRWFESCMLSVRQIEYGFMQGRCPSCKTELELTGQQSSAYDASVFKTVTDEFHRYGDDIEAKDDFSRIQKLIKKHGPFGVVIDGSNIGTSVRGSSFKKPVFDASIISETIASVNSLCSEGKILLVLLRPNSSRLWTEYNSLVAEMKAKHKNLHYFICTTIDDDLTVLYAAIVSELRHQNEMSGMYSRQDNIKILTNDLMRNHRFLFHDDRQWDLLRWIRHRLVQVRDEGDAYGRSSGLRLVHKLVDPVPQWTDEAWHFPLADGSWLCIDKKSE